MSSSGQQQKRRRKSNTNVRQEPRMMRMDALSNRTPREKGKAPASNTWELTPVSILLRTMSYLDNATLMIMCLVCKQIKELIWNGNGMETKLIRVFELHPLRHDHYEDRLLLFLQNMNHYFQDDTKRRMLQGYQHLKLMHNGTYKFPENFGIRNIAQLLPNMSMAGIVSLDASSPVLVEDIFFFLDAVAYFVPNLQQLDLSNIESCARTLTMFAQRCPQLEVIKWMNDDFHFERCIYAAGWYKLESMDNLRELYLDNFSFFCENDINNSDDDNSDDDNNNNNGNEDDVTEDEAMSNLNDYPTIFFFSKARNTPLERFSIRNARCHVGLDGDRIIQITQNMLIKFVRNAPSTLVWFRSDLSAASIQVLQAERPGIEFVQ